MRELLRRDPRSNLYLIDLVGQLCRGRSSGEARPELLGVRRGRTLIGVAGVRPTLVVDAAADEATVEACLPLLASVGHGLMKCEMPLADQVWKALEGRGRRALVDRFENAFWLRPEWCVRRDAPAGASIRPAQTEDLEELIHAARASLREEDRPDPFEGDPAGFRRWVSGRVSRALVVDDGRAAFVGYADVRLPEGWLLQGIYTWPARRQRGLAAAGVSALCEAAFEQNADHVQLAVVEGNEPAERLYRSLGFRPFARLRTILFG